MINDFEFALEKSAGWRMVADSINNDRCPQTLAVIVPSSMQVLFVRKFAGLLLTNDKSLNDIEHPDLINAGTTFSPPSIEECRTLRSELALFPIEAKYRLAVIWEANKLSKEASNSLLKLTEEPPKHGYILLVSEEDNFIPTIKSRVTLIHIDFPSDIVLTSRLPGTTEDFIHWIKLSKKKNNEELYLEIEGWINDLLNKKLFFEAEKLESILKIIRHKRLSVSMTQDIIYGSLKEGVSTEQAFSSLWAT